MDKVEAAKPRAKENHPDDFCLALPCLRSSRGDVKKSWTVLIDWKKKEVNKTLSTVVKQKLRKPYPTGEPLVQSEKALS